MKTSATTSKNASAKKDNKKNVTVVNLEKFAKQLENVNVKEKKEKETIYIYPADFSHADINAEKGKKHRNKLRSKMQKFANNIFVFTKTNQPEKLKAEINLFFAFYKENYKINDLTLNSISNSKDEQTTKDLSLMLEIIKEVETKK